MTIDDELDALDAYWRAANYLTVGQIYLIANPLLREPLRPEHIKPRLLGHWGTSPGLSLIYAHLNRVIRRDDTSMIFLAGPGHGGPERGARRCGAADPAPQRLQDRRPDGARPRRRLRDPPAVRGPRLRGPRGRRRRAARSASPARRRTRYLRRTHPGCAACGAHPRR